jgi:hypothetical protein
MFIADDITLDRLAGSWRIFQMPRKHVITSTYEIQGCRLVHFFDRDLRRWGKASRCREEHTCGCANLVKDVRRRTGMSDRTRRLAHESPACPTLPSG